MSFGPSWPAVLQQVAQQADRILRGARAGDVPMEQPSRFELVINLATAKAVGVTVPRPLRLRADDVIQ